MRRILVVSLITAAALAGSGGAALAAPNPSGTGQPNADCEALGTLPPGFTTDGFAHAQTVYAGSGVSADHAASTHAVSQYDVACFQQSVNHGG